MKPVAAALLACLFATACAQTPPAGDAFAISEVAPGVYVHNGQVDDWLPSNGGDVANLGFVVGSRCVAVIDTGGTPEVGRRWHDAIRRVTPLPICWVIDTHAHPDHVLGNGAFAGEAGVRFVAAAHFDKALAAREPFFENALQRDFGIRLTHAELPYPTVGVDKTMELDLGGRTLLLQAWPTAHTDNDLTILDRKTRTLYTGDLLFVEHMPVVDGSLKGWLAVLPELAKTDAAVAVPGHGAVSHDWPAVLKAEQDYLNALLVETRAAIKSRMTLAQAVDRVGAAEAAHWKLADRFHRRNVTAAYAELEWED
ncbi:MAG: quinoprotein relay system zinc metallohydrolase 2 [Proteobacteria bacterium]|nr:quinoprotein relay system zinc metallohydrolase 2 [Pseudomonadota bacterium]